MSKVLMYTFKSFPLKNDSLSANVRVFKSINSDTNIFCEEIRRIKPDLIIGFAKFKNKQSTIEQYAINKFQRNKKVIQGAPTEYELDIPKEFEGQYRIRTSPTDSFCNLSAFKIKHFLQENELDIPCAFIHVAKNDLDAFTSSLLALQKE